MATLMPALVACVSRMTAGERRRVQNCRLSERRASEGPRVGRHGCDLPTLRRDGGIRPGAEPLATAAPGVQSSGNFNPLEDTIKVLTMHAGKGLEFPVVALMGVGQMPASGDDERDEARLFYVGRQGRHSGW